MPVPMASQLILGPARLRHVKKSLTLTANNETLSQNVFTLTGAIYVLGIWGEVTTVIGSNHTAAHLRLDDQTAQIVITAAAGITLSSLAAGTMFAKLGLAAAALTLMSNAARATGQGAAQDDLCLQTFQVVKKTGATTDIEYRYSTTNAPTTGVILFNAVWLPLSSDGNLVAA